MIYLAIGRRERGKSTLVYHCARTLPQRLVIDPRRQFDLPSPRATTPDQVDEWIEKLASDSTLEEVIVTPTESVQPVFEAVCDGVQRWIEMTPPRPLAVVVDEARFYDLSIEPFQWILRCAPRDLVYVFITAHRPKDDEIPISVQSIADQWFLFHTRQSHDLKVIRERAGDEVADRVQSLPAFQWICWNDGTGEFQIHDNPRAWYTPISRRRIVATVDQVIVGRAPTRARGLFDA